MLAYTTISDYIHAPSGLEVAVYMGGLLLVMALPTVVFGIADKVSEKKSSTKTSRPSA